MQAPLHREISLQELNLTLLVNSVLEAMTVLLSHFEDMESEGKFVNDENVFSAVGQHTLLWNQHQSPEFRLLVVQVHSVVFQYQMRMVSAHRNVIENHVIFCVPPEAIGSPSHIQIQNDLLQDLPTTLYIEHGDLDVVVELLLLHTQEFFSPPVDHYMFLERVLANIASKLLKLVDNNVLRVSLSAFLLHPNQQAIQVDRIVLEAAAKLPLEFVALSFLFHADSADLGIGINWCRIVHSVLLSEIFPQLLDSRLVLNQLLFLAKLQFAHFELLSSQSKDVSFLQFQGSLLGMVLHQNPELARKSSILVQIFEHNPSALLVNRQRQLAEVDILNDLIVEVLEEKFVSQLVQKQTVIPAYDEVLVVELLGGGQEVEHSVGGFFPAQDLDVDTF